MKTVKIAAAGALLLALTAGEASAKQASYIYLECDVQVSGRPGPQVYRIGNGQWDFMANPDWEALEWVGCGEQRQRDNLIYIRTCTFNDREFRSDINLRSAIPDMSWWSAAIVHSVDRYSGAMTFVLLMLDPNENRNGQGACRPIQEPTPAERIF